MDGYICLGIGGIGVLVLGIIMLVCLIKHPGKIGTPVHVCVAVASFIIVETGALIMMGLAAYHIFFVPAAIALL